MASQRTRIRWARIARKITADAIEVHNDEETSVAEVTHNGWHVSMAGVLDGHDWDAYIMVKDQSGDTVWEVGGSASDFDDPDDLEDFAMEFSDMPMRSPSENWKNFSDSKLKDLMGDDWDAVLKILEENE